MMVRTGAQHICLEPMARDMVELLPGAEWKGRQRLTLPPAPVLHELHPMLHAPQAPPPSVLSEVFHLEEDASELVQKVLRREPCPQLEAFA